MSLINSVRELWHFEVPYSFGKAVCLMISAAMIGASAMALLISASCGISYGTIIETDPSSPLQIGNSSNLTMSEDSQDVDIQIDLDDISERIENQTWTSPIGDQVTDIDLNGIIPEGVTIIATHDKLYVTKAPWTLDLTDEIKEELRRQIADP